MWLTELKAAANCKDSKNAIFDKIILLRVFEDCTITDVFVKAPTNCKDSEDPIFSKTVLFIYIYII